MKISTKGPPFRCFVDRFLAGGLDTWKELQSVDKNNAQHASHANFRAITFFSSYTYFLQTIPKCRHDPNDVQNNIILLIRKLELLLNIVLDPFLVFFLLNIQC